MGVLCQLLLTITTDLSVKEGYVKIAIKSIQLVNIGMHQREEA